VGTKSPSRRWSASSPPVMKWMAIRPASGEVVEGCRQASEHHGLDEAGPVSHQDFQVLGTVQTVLATAQPSGPTAP
jgi:hypothetical protein